MKDGGSGGGSRPEKQNGLGGRQGPQQGISGGEVVKAFFSPQGKNGPGGKENLLPDHPQGWYHPRRKKIKD